MIDGVMLSRMLLVVVAEVVLRGVGSDGMPDIAVNFPLTQKTSLPNNAGAGVSNWRARFNVAESEEEVHEKASTAARQVAAYNACVGVRDFRPILRFPFHRRDRHDQESVDKLGQTLTTSKPSRGDSR